MNSKKIYFISAVALSVAFCAASVVLSYALSPEALMPFAFPPTTLLIVTAAALLVVNWLAQNMVNSASLRSYVVVRYFLDSLASARAFLRELYRSSSLEVRRIFHVSDYSRA